MKQAKKKAKAKPVKRVKRKSKFKRVASLAKGISVVEKPDGTFMVTGKNAKALEGAIVERRERDYKFDERLVPYYLGGDGKDSNLDLRQALIQLGKTAEMAELFDAMRASNMGYRDDAKETFMKALYAVIKGHDEIAMTLLNADDIKAIHDNNLKTFNEFWDALDNKRQEEFEGFSD